MSLRFSFLPPSVGDQLVSNATGAKINLSRWATDGQLDCSIELTSEVAAGDAAELLAALVRELKQPRSPQEEGGIA